MSTVRQEVTGQSFRAADSPPIPHAATSNGIPERAGYSIPEAGVLLGGASAATIYRWANRGLIRLVKVGSRTLVPASEIARLTAGQSSA